MPAKLRLMIKVVEKMMSRELRIKWSETATVPRDLCF